MTSATWHRVRVTAARPLAETLATALSELYSPPAEAVGLFEAGAEDWQVDAYFRESPDEDRLRAFFTARGADVENLTIEPVPDTDWVTVAQSRLGPVRAGRFVIHGSHDRDTVRRNRWSIEIDAAQAFGTAHHGSTRGCLEALDALARKHDFSRILDLGTGTGVLAIAAARLWPASVIASDIDPVATRIAAGNVALNDVTAQVTAITAAGLDHPAIRAGTPYELIIANILARPLITMTPDIARATQPGGVIVLSGITKDQAERVAVSYRSAGFVRDRPIAIDEWMTLVLRRR